MDQRMILPMPPRSSQSSATPTHHHAHAQTPVIRRFPKRRVTPPRLTAEQANLQRWLDMNG